MLKKVLSLTTVLALSLGALTMSFAEKNITPEDKINSLLSEQIISGYKDGTLRLEKSITRAEFSSVLAKILIENEDEDYLKKLGENSNFGDVDAKSWANPYINVLVDKGIVSGYKDNTYRPNNDITFKEAITMIVRSLDIDVEEGSSWSEGYINKAKEIGLLDGVEVSDYSAASNRHKIFELIYNTLELNK